MIMTVNIDLNYFSFITKVCSFQFALLVVIIITTEIAAAVTSYLRRAEMQDMLHERVNITMQEYPTHPGTQKSWDIMQHEVSQYFCLLILRVGSYLL